MLLTFLDSAVVPHTNPKRERGKGLHVTLPSLALRVSMSAKVALSYQISRTLLESGWPSQASAVSL